MGVVSNGKSKKKPTFHWGRGGGRGRKRECVREGKVASARVVCRDVEMPLPNIISGPLSACIVGSVGYNTCHMLSNQYLMHQHLTLVDCTYFY